MKIRRNSKHFLTKLSAFTLTVLSISTIAFSVATASEKFSPPKSKSNTTRSISPRALAQGEPGCWALVSGRAVIEEEAALFPKACASFRSVYNGALDLYSQQPKELQTRLESAIKKAKSPAPPYHAIILSVFTLQQDGGLELEDRSLNALNARAAIETKLKVKYAYAKAAVERLTSGKCSEIYQSSFFSEICNGRDAAFERLRKLK